MTQVGRLIMLKENPFHSLIYSFELRERFTDTLTHFVKNIIPRNRQDLNRDNAKWFLNHGHKNFTRGTALTIMMDCCKEYLSIANNSSPIK